MTLINWMGGRKVVLGYVFMACTTFLVFTEARKPLPDYIGMSTVLLAIAGGLTSVVWGNVKEHQATAKTEQVTVQP